MPPPFSLALATSMKIGNAVGLGLIAATFAFFAGSILSVRRESHRIYDSLRIGAEIRELGWPNATLVGFACGGRSMEAPIFTSKTEWEAVIQNPGKTPPECKEVLVMITGGVPYHAYWHIEFDDHWKISKLGPLEFRAS